MREVRTWRKSKVLFHRSCGVQSIAHLLGINVGKHGVRVEGKVLKKRKKEVEEWTVVSMRRAWEGAGRDDSGAASQACSLLLSAVVQCGPQLMSCMCARTCRIIHYRTPGSTFSKCSREVSWSDFRDGLKDRWKTGFIKGLSTKGKATVCSVKEASHTHKGGKGERCWLLSCCSSEAK